MGLCMVKALALAMIGVTMTASGKMDSDMVRATWFGQTLSMKVI